MPEGSERTTCEGMHCTLAVHAHHEPVHCAHAQMYEAAQRGLDRAAEVIDSYMQDVTRLTTELAAVREERDILEQRATTLADGEIGPHAGPDGMEKCPAWYEGCHCTVESFASAFRIMKERGVALALVSGALCDTGNVVPGDEARYGDAIRELTDERDDARTKLAASEARAGVLEKALRRAVIGFEYAISAVETRQDRAKMDGYFVLCRDAALTTPGAVGEDRLSVEEREHVEEIRQHDEICSDTLDDTIAIIDRLAPPTRDSTICSWRMVK